MTNDVRDAETDRLLATGLTDASATAYASLAARPTRTIPTGGVTTSLPNHTR